MNRLLVFSLVVAAISCGRSPAVSDSSDSTLQNQASSTPVAPARSVSDELPRIVALGDSLTAGYGLDPADAYPAVLQRKLDQKHYRFHVVNAGVSGDTSADGLRRLEWALDGDVRVLIVALGGNDGLRGLPPAQMKENLGKIITRARQRGIDVLLAGIEAPPNFGEQYTREFRAVFKALATENHVTFVPFLLTGVAGISAVNQRDGIHPTARGAAMIADTLWPPLEQLLARPVR